MSYALTVLWEDVWHPEITFKRCMTHIGYIPDHVYRPIDDKRCMILTFNKEEDATMFLLHCLTPKNRRIFYIEPNV